jgi:hypothetical protein
MNLNIPASHIGVLQTGLKRRSGDFLENGVRVLMKYDSFIETAYVDKTA